ncbi:MAG: 4-alpha-glucanotransferase [Anaerolineales bacterium]|nr:4-alpha-glucanotransferase [Anaerolineales bacterium]
MLFQRESGILLPVSALPGRYGIGDLGPGAYAWLDFLHAARTRWWQVLPLGPTGYGNSPYQSYSSFAGSPNLISPELLLADGLIDAAHLEQAPAFPAGKVDYDRVAEWKRGLCQVAYLRLKDLPQLHVAFESFRVQHAGWLEDYALFMALKDQESARPWGAWPAGLRDRRPEALDAARQTHAANITFYAFQQFLFFRQWDALRVRMAELGIGVIGDLPIYVSEDSADVWTARELFEIDEHGQPLRVAGVPPDMFSATGQRWGNPVYRWEAHREQGYAWWLARLQAVLSTVDVLRLDHFRGFANYYAIPASEPTAMHGTWELGPGVDFFETVRQRLGSLPLIAEDLGGEIEPLVTQLRDRFNLPGMRVFQFAFESDMDHIFLPHNYPANCVAYTGTHDNDTVVGWFANAPEDERKFCLEYLNSNGLHIAWDMLHSLWASPAGLVMAPIQDFLELGGEARFNLPGTPLGNWDWRMDGELLTPDLAARIAALNAEGERTYSD